MLTMYLAMLGSEADRERFALLYEAHEKRLYAVALKILGTPPRRRTPPSRPGSRCCAAGSGSTPWSGTRRPNIWRWRQRTPPWIF